MYIPDPIEQMENRIEVMCGEQLGVPDGSFRCSICKMVIKGEPEMLNGRPDSPICCVLCLDEMGK